MNWNRVKSVCLFINWFLSISLAVFAIIVYTIEYVGENGRPGPIKVFLDTPISISMTMFLAFLYGISFSCSSLILYVAKKSILSDKKTRKKHSNEVEKMQHELNVKTEQLIKIENELRELKDSEVQTRRNQDAHVIRRLIGQLPIQDMKIYCKETDFGNTISGGFLKMMEGFGHEKSDPTFVFFDKVLEEEKKVVQDSFEEINNIFIQHMDRVDDNSWRIDRELRSCNPSEYTKVIRLLNEMSSKAWASYEKIISIGWKDYGISSKREP